MGKRITGKERDRIIELYCDGYKTYKIARIVGASENAVNRTTRADKLASAGDLDALMRVCKHNESLFNWVNHKYGIIEKYEQLDIPFGEDTESEEVGLGEILEQLKMVVDVETKILSAINSLADCWR